LRVECDDLLLLQNCLVDDRRLSPAAALERKAVESAARAILSEWVEWRMATPIDTDQNL